MRTIAKYGFLIAVSVVAAPVSAHHGFASIFDMNSVVTLQGTVSRYDWRNPHVYVYVDEIIQTPDCRIFVKSSLFSGQVLVNNRN